MLYRYHTTRPAARLFHIRQNTGRERCWDRSRCSSSLDLQLGDLLPLEDVSLIHDLVPMVMPKEPPGEPASLSDGFQKVRQLIRTIAGIELFDDAAGGTVGQDAVHYPVCPLQICQRLTVAIVPPSWEGPPTRADGRPRCFGSG